MSILLLTLIFFYFANLMPLFQSAVLTKYLAHQDNVRMAAAFEKFRSHFHNAGQQERIRNLKEEEYQEGFLRDLLVSSDRVTFCRPHSPSSRQCQRSTGSERTR